MKKMIPELLGNMIANPLMFEDQFINYLTKLGFDCTQVEKTIGKMSLYHFQTTAGLAEQKFFTGNFVAAQSNVPGNNFVRPLGEHFVIYAIKIEQATGANYAALDWVPGAGDVFAKNSVLTVKINGLDRSTKMPLAEAQENLTTSDNGMIVLDEPIIWGGQVPMVATVTSNDSTVVGAAQSWLRITFEGIGLFS